MGCGSQTGCLGPKPRQRQVYVDLVENIHSEAREMTIPESSDAYVHAKNQLKKSGNLKKLIDNLVSHKSNLYECSNQILQITAKASSLAQNVTCLVVVDKIIGEFFKSQPEEKPELKQAKSSPPKMMSIDDIMPVIATMALSPEIPIDIEQRVNIIYFKIILVLFEKEPILCKDILESLLNFLSLKDDKINCKNQITRLFELLITNLKKGKMVEKTNQIIPLLLSRMKENLSCEISKEYMSFFTKKWFYKGQKDRQAITVSYRYVLEELIVHSFGNIENIVLALVFILDQDKFQTAGTNKIEDLLLHNHEHEELGRQVIRSLAIFLLKYLKIGEESCDIDHYKFKNAEYDKCKVHCFRLLNKWFKQNYVNINSIVQYNPCAIITAYATSIQKTTSALRQELKKQYIELIQCLNAFSLLTITNILAEEMKDGTSSKAKRQIHFNMLQDIYLLRSAVLKEEELITRSKFLVDFEQYYSRQIQESIMKFNIQNLKAMDVEKIRSNPQFHRHFRNRLCQFLHSVFEIVVSSFSPSDDLAQKAINSTNDLMKKMKKITNTHRFLLGILNFFKVMHEKQLHSYLMVFIGKVNSFIKELDPVDNQKEALTLFFLAFLIESTLYLLNKKERIDDSIAKLSLKLEKQPLNLDIRHQILEKANQLIKSDDTIDTPELELESTGSPKKQQSTTEWFKDKNDKKINLTEELLMVKKTQRLEVMEAFKDLFGEFTRESKSKATYEQFGDLVFQRQPSINQERNNEKGSCRDEGQESFDEIIGRIREE